MSQNRLEALLGKGFTIMPGVHNALSAVLAERANFKSVFVTGAGVSNNFLGEPDLGFLTFDQLRGHVEQILLKVSIPVFVDFDAGYGDTKMVKRQARQLASIGVAGVFIEDQVQPKRCGHFEGKRVVNIPEMTGKIRALREISDELVVVARTDALAIEGEPSALERAARYHAAGADATFIEAPQTTLQMRKIGELPWPQIANLVEGGKTPLLNRRELEKMGYFIALYANFASRMAMKAMEVAYKSLALQGDTSMLLDEMMSFGERQEILGLPEWEAFEASLAADAKPGS